MQLEKRNIKFVTLERAFYDDNSTKSKISDKDCMYKMFTTYANNNIQD